MLFLLFFDNVDFLHKVMLKVICYLKIYYKRKSYKEYTTIFALEDLATNKNHSIHFAIKFKIIIKDKY